MRKIVPLRAPAASLAAWKSFIAAVESCLVFNFKGLFTIDVSIYEDISPIFQWLFDGIKMFP